LAGWYQGSIRDGVRQTAASVYLDEEELKLTENLHVLVNTRVTRVLPATEGSTSFTTIQLGNDASMYLFVSKKCCIGFDFETESSRNLTANKEVILSAGAINTPSILLHSGIGDDATLQKLGIKPLHSLPGVGQNLIDQPYIPAVWSVNSTAPPYALPLHTSVVQFHLSLDRVDPDAALDQWQKSHTGPYTMSVTSPNNIAYTRIANLSSVFPGQADPAAGPNTPHVEICPLVRFTFANVHA
jgi:choline dehydrogenase-like flavoprotein